MPAQTRIYFILDRATGKTLRGVRAATQPSALAHYSADITLRTARNRLNSWWRFIWSWV